MDRGITQRFTEYRFSSVGDVRRSESSELYVIRPHKELDEIIGRIDGILAGMAVLSTGTKVMGDGKVKARPVW